MKLTLAIALGAACALSGTANAQKGEDYQPPQWKGELPIPLDRLPLSAQLQLDPKLPPYPRLNTAQAAGTQIRVLPTYRGPMFQVEVVRQSVADVLRAVAAPMGVKVVIDPELEKIRYPLAVFRALSYEELFDAAGSGLVEKWKSASGTYFFATKPAPKNPVVFRKMPDGTWQRVDEASPPPQTPESMRGGPFSYGPGKDAPDIDPEFNPNSRFGSKFVPPPEAEKREFNGREYYHIPLPAK